MVCKIDGIILSSVGSGLLCTQEQVRKRRKLIMTHSDAVRRCSKHREMNQDQLSRAAVAMVSCELHPTKHNIHLSNVYASKGRLVIVATASQCTWVRSHR